MTRLTFLGAAGTVTGSKYLVETGRARLLVDCGLFQGFKSLRERNWSDLPFEASSLDAVVLTHAHIDHSGFLPRLCKMGFRGRAYCTNGTRDLLEVLLPDSGHLQEDAATHAERWGYSKHHPALPLYTQAEAEASLKCLEPVGFHQSFEPASGVSAQFTRAGHIIGSGCLSLRIGDKSILFSGDVGRPADPIMKPPEELPPTDFLVIESTYGDRRHPAEPATDALARIVKEAAERGGTLLVPAFAVGRAQHLLHLLAGLRKAGRIPDIPVYLDSPMAIKATNIFCRHKDDHGLTDPECHALCDLPQYTSTPEQSKAIAFKEGPMVVISASGMATGGRILHHLQRCLPGEENTVLLVGYQAAGTRGRSLADGADELKMFGMYVPVRARVERLEGLSAHADYAEMIAWLQRSRLSPKRVFVTHGEPAGADAFRRRLKDAFGWDAVVPGDGSTWKLDEEGKR